MAKETKAKKPFYKRWWVWVIAVIIVIAIAGGGDDDSEKAEGGTNEKNEAEENKGDHNDQNAASNNSDIVKETSDTDEETEEALGDKNEEQNEDNAKDGDEESDADEEAIPSGTYKIGDDIPAGEYLVFSLGMGYIESATDSTGELESILFNDNLVNDAHSYVTLNDGEYFKMDRAEMYPVDSAPSVKPEDGVYEDGMYKVGEDLPAEEYKVVLDGDMGYIEVSENSSHQLDSVITNDNLESDTYITVSEGQYIKIRDVHIEQ